jgi:hypothetical protein
LLLLTANNIVYCTYGEKSYKGFQQLHADYTISLIKKNTPYQARYPDCGVGQRAGGIQKPVRHCDDPLHPESDSTVIFQSKINTKEIQASDSGMTTC